MGRGVVGPTPAATPRGANRRSCHNQPAHAGVGLRHLTRAGSSPPPEGSQRVPAPARSEARLQWLGAHTPGDTAGHTLASTPCPPDTEDTQSHVADPVDWPPISPEVLLVSRTTTAAVPRHDLELRVRIA